MNAIKIGYFADGPWGYNGLAALLNDESVKIAFVVPRKRTQDKNLENLCKKYNIPFLQDTDINSAGFYHFAVEQKCDLLVSMSFDQIFRRKILDLPELGVINCHAGKLPFYRGRNVLNWVLINDEKEFGITTHFVDEGIDTGDIILQKTLPITDQDDYKSLLNVAYTACSDALVETIKLIQNGAYTRIPQKIIHPVGLYCGIRSNGDEIINWNQSSRLIFNFIRAICYPGPMATTFFRGIEIKINKAYMIPDAPNYIGKPGQIIGKLDDKFVIKTLDSTILIDQIYSANQLKIGELLGKQI